MSKSLGNFFTVRDLLDQGVPGEVMRFVLLGTHYRKPMDWTAEKAAQAKKTLRSWYLLSDGVQAADALPEYLTNVLANDLNTAGFLAYVHELANAEKAPEVKAALRLLGFPDAESVDWFRHGPTNIATSGTSGGSHHLMHPFLEEWQKLRLAQRYAEADNLKKKLAGVGVEVSSTIHGPRGVPLDNFDPEKLKALK